MKPSRTSAVAAPARPASASRRALQRLPPTVTRPALLSSGSDRAFRQFVHRLLAFSTRLETIRAGFGAHVGLSGIQYSALISIAHLGRDQPVGVKEIADHLSLSGSFATLVVGQLVGRDLVYKETNPDDRRRVRLTVTEAGTTLLSRLAPVQQQVNDMLFTPLDTARFAQLNEAFAELVRSADAAVNLTTYLTGNHDRD